VPVQATGYPEVAAKPPVTGSADREREGRGDERAVDAATARFQAVVRIVDVAEPDALSARRTVEERLQRAGFSRWWLVSLNRQVLPSGVPRQRQRLAQRTELRGTGAGILLAGAIAAWGLWLLWLLAG
jgi:hypothetical protein